MHLFISFVIYFGNAHLGAQVHPILE